MNQSGDLDYLTVGDQHNVPHLVKTTLDDLLASSGRKLSLWAYGAKVRTVYPSQPPRLLKS
jgi:hypothetical protein